MVCTQSTDFMWHWDGLYDLQEKKYIIKPKDEQQLTWSNGKVFIRQGDRAGSMM